ncbi:MAG TPA: lysophospholipid acyltransferase family protein [Polyangiales bacterium]
MTSSATARKAWLMPLARSYVRRTLRRRFDGVWVEGLARAQREVEQAPLIVAVNHVAFWDPLVALQLDSLLGTESHCLMDERNLAHYPFFAWVGAIPLARRTNKRMLSQLRSAATLLTGPRRALWIFPQGRQRPAHLWPHALSSGVAWLSREARASVLPLAIGYAFREAREPAVLASFGSLIEAGHDPMLGALEAAWIAALDRIDRFVDRSQGQFEALVPPKRAPGREVPALGRLLARLLGASGHARLGAGEKAT